MIRGSTAIAGRRRGPGRRVQGGRAQREADDAPDREQAVAGHRELQHEQDDRQADEQEPRDVERQAAEADEREDDGERADDAGHEVRALELEQQAVEPQREQDERDVGVGQQVEERLGRVHRDARPVSAPAVAIVVGDAAHAHLATIGRDAGPRRWIPAMPSMAPSARASLAGDERASRTVSSAQSAFRPRVSAIERMLAIGVVEDLLAERAARCPRPGRRPATRHRCSCPAPSARHGRRG